MVERQEGQLVRALAGKAQQQLHALGDLDGLFLHDAQTDLGAGQVLHDGDGLVQLLFHVTDVIDDTDEILGRTVGEVQAEDADAGFDELTQLFLGVGSRADGGDDLGSHRVFLGSCPCGDTDFLYSAVCPEETIRAFQQVVKRKAPSARPLSPGEAPDRGLK